MHNECTLCKPIEMLQPTELCVFGFSHTALVHANDACNSYRMAVLVAQWNSGSNRFTIFIVLLDFIVFVVGMQGIDSHTIIGNLLLCPFWRWLLFFLLTQSPNVSSTQFWEQWSRKMGEIFVFSMQSLIFQEIFSVSLSRPLILRNPNMLGARYVLTMTTIQLHSINFQSQCWAKLSWADTRI